MIPHEPISCQLASVRISAVRARTDATNHNWGKAVQDAHRATRAARALNDRLNTRASHALLLRACENEISLYFHRRALVADVLKAADAIDSGAGKLED